MTTVFTIGHSTHPLDEFVDILNHHGIRMIADVRTIPRSRHNPQFNEDALGPSLIAREIEYRRFESLGGLRHTHKNSPNGAWRNLSFRGYADYMQTEAFSTAVDELIDVAETTTLAIMCAEAVPWRCHRSLIGDALLVRGVEVFDIMGIAALKAETLTPFAYVAGTTITYPPESEVAEQPKK